MRIFVFMRRYVVFLLLALLPLTASAQMKDTLRVLCIGNSFTYVCEAHQKLVDLAASEGHHIVMNAQYVGGFTFGRHLQRDETLNAIERPGPQDAFDAVFLQNQSQLHARYATDPDRYAYVLADAKELSGRVRQYSPQARIYLESTWSYPASDCGGFGSLEAFDANSDRGTELLAKACGARVSYIGKAFARARAAAPDIELLADDAKHQNDYGSYLKACVNYLLLYGERFDARAASCGLDPAKCARLRAVAEEVVLAGNPDAAFAVRPANYAGSTVRFKALLYYATNVEEAHRQFALQAIDFFRKLTDGNGWELDVTQDLAASGDLSRYDLIIMPNAAPGSARERSLFEKYMEDGGGWLGFHAAGYNDRSTGWDWFRTFLGGVSFRCNNWPPQPALVQVEGHSHAINRNLPDRFVAPATEFYQWQPDLRSNPDVTVLASLAPENFPMGLKDIVYGGDWPLVWSNGRYRMVYINMGHGDACFSDATQNLLFVNALRWVVSTSPKGDPFQ